MNVHPRIVRRFLCALAAIALIGFSVPAHAGINCSVSMTTVAFGSIDVLPGTAFDTTGTLSITCSTDPNITIHTCLSIAAGSANDATSRQMNGPSTTKLRFELYSDSARTQKWGSYVTGLYGGGIPFNFNSGSGNITQPVTVYARVLASQQTTIPGSYTSTFSGQPVLDYDDKGNACPLNAHTATSSFTATATVISSCNVSATTHDFGSASSLGSNVDATSTITTTCTSTTPYNIGLDAGTGSGATVTTRKMTAGAATINYSLYTNSGRTTVWGNTIGTNTVSGTGSGAGQPLTVYGRVPSQATPAPATYTDTIVTTVTY